MKITITPKLAIDIYKAMLNTTAMKDLQPTKKQREHIGCIFWTTNLTNCDDAIAIIKTYLAENNLNDFADAHAHFGFDLNEMLRE